MADGRPDLEPQAGTAAGSADTLEALVVQATRLAVGAALVTAAGISALFSPQRGRADAGDERMGGEEPPAERAAVEGVVPFLAAAALAVALEAERRAVTIERLVEGGVRTAVNVARLTLPSVLSRALEVRARAWSDRGRAEARVGVDGVVEAWNRLLDDVVAQVLGHIDLEELIGSVDIDAIVARVDVERIVERIDLDAVAGRIDLDAIVRRIDLDSIVGRLDVDAVVRRVDVEGIVREVDLAAIARQVLDEIGVESIIRESTGSLTVQTVDALRASGADADRRLSRFVDRLLQRDHERDVRIGDGDGSREADEAAAGEPAPTGTGET
jgi:hypothetical protein